jgi:hypothetical protein
MTMAKRIKKIQWCVMIGRRWFRKSAGNTYTSVSVYVNGKHLGTTIDGGYGDYYRQMGFKVLQSAGYWSNDGALINGFDSDQSAFNQFVMDNRGKFVFEVVDVPTEKDL